jgi:hypothetical protein
MKYNQFEIGTKFRYKNKDWIVVGYYFDCGGDVMIVQAVKYDINNGTKILWVYDISDDNFDKCELIV